MGDDDGWDRTSREPDNRYFFGEQGQKRASDEQGGRPWNGNNRQQQDFHITLQSHPGRGGDDGGSGRGRGRGHTLPEWMTLNSNSDGPAR